MLFKNIAAFILIIILAVSSSSLNGAPLLITGKVINEVGGEPVPYASVAVTGSRHKVLTDSLGSFRIYSTSTTPKLIVSAMGFSTVKIPYSDFKKNNCVISLLNSGLQMGEVIVKPRKERYSKKNNPAVDLMKRIATFAKMNDPYSAPFFKTHRYEVFKIGINNYDSAHVKDPILKRYSFLNDYVDTSTITGKPILNLSLREKSSDIYSRSNPAEKREIIEAFRQSGVDEFLDSRNMALQIAEVFRDIDIFNNTVVILKNHFVSPLSNLAPDFYKFYITDTVQLDSVKCIELSFVPRNSNSLGFTGKMYVEDNDSSPFVHRVEMNVPRDINLNFVQRLFIFQNFKRGEQGTRLKTSEELTAEIKLLPGIPDIYVEKRTRFNNFSFAEPQNPDSIFSAAIENESLNNVSARDSSFWQGVRYTPFGVNDLKTSDMMNRLRRDKFYRVLEFFLRFSDNPYISTGHNSKFDIGPIGRFVSYNHLEGLRLYAGGLTTANLNKHLFARGYLAYGIKDEKWKYDAQLEWSFNQKRYHSQEFPVHSLALGYGYDVDMLGQKYDDLSLNAFFLSIQRKTDYQITYRNRAALTYTLELANNFSVVTDVTKTIQHATPWMNFVTGTGITFYKYKETAINIKLRYSPGEKVHQAKSGRMRINEDAPIFEIKHTYAPANLFGNNFPINKTELGYRQRFWLSAFGKIDLMIKAGHIWSKSPYPDLYIPPSNLSYALQPGTFALLNPMEFVNDSYAQFNFTYKANGILFNYIPLLKKLKLREMLSFSGLFGHLSNKNNPQYNPDTFLFPEISQTQIMSGRPYLECSAGIGNIFKVLRLDYVWRLSYLQNPGIDKHGLRFSLHFSF